MLCERLLQPGESFVFIAHAGVRQSKHAHRVRFPSSVCLSKFIQRISGPSHLPRPPTDIGLIRPNPWPILAAAPSVYFGECVGEFPFLHVGSNRYVSVTKARFHGEDSAVL